MPKRESVKVRFAATLIVTLVAIALPSPAGAYHLEGGRWPTATITYYNEVPAYAWAVDTAAYAWNTSGARVKFVKGSRRDAKVLVGIRWYKIAGDAYVQRTNGRFVSAKVGIQSGQDRYTMALVVAHELGHVLGLEPIWPARQRLDDRERGSRRRLGPRERGRGDRRWLRSRLRGHHER